MMTVVVQNERLVCTTLLSPAYIQLLFQKVRYRFAGTADTAPIIYGRIGAFFILLLDLERPDGGGAANASRTTPISSTIAKVCVEQDGTLAIWLRELDDVAPAASLVERDVVVDAAVGGAVVQNGTGLDVENGHVGRPLPRVVVKSRSVDFG